MTTGIEPDGAATMHEVFDAIEDGDIAAFRSFFTEDAAIWHNHNLAESSLDATAQTMAALHRVTREIRYGERNYVSLPDGAVAQHVLTAVTIGGAAVVLPLMLRAYFQGGKIVRVEEYADTAQSRPIVEAFAAL